VLGYDVDLTEQIAQRLGVSARYVSIDIGSIHDGLLAKKFDVIISSLPPFPEFTKSIAYSRPYFNAGQVLLVNHDTQAIDDLNDLSDGVIGVEGASAGDIEVRKLVSPTLNITVRPYSAAEMLVPARKAKEVQAAVVDAVTAMELARGQKEIKVVGRPLTTEPYVIAARKTDALLLKEIDRALADLESDGTLDSLRTRWLEPS
jgi:ABC-type amino acid transport substrate-binding protein